jgi:hypothetical protein
MRIEIYRSEGPLEQDKDKIFYEENFYKEEIKRLKSENEALKAHISYLSQVVRSPW